MARRVETQDYAKALYVKAAHQWGNRAQMDMVQEECAELIQAVSKVKRSGINIVHAAHEDMAKEIADVRIMIAQMEQMFNLETLVDHFIVDKLARLELRISNSQKEL